MQEVSGHLCGHVRGVARPPITIDLEAPPDQTDHGSVGHGGVEPWQRGREMGSREGFQRAPLYGHCRPQWSAGQNLEQNHTEAEDVGALILVSVSTSLLRGHITRRSQQVSRDGDR